MSNVGNVDRIVRFVLGALLVVAPFVTGWAFWAGWPTWAAVIVGLVLIGTASISFCPIYAALRLNTRHKS